jgi:putative ABC transport system permease protein
MRAEEVYAVLLHLYPAAFREEYEREMRLAFRRRHREKAGPVGRTLLWISILADTFTTATQEHFDMLMRDVRYILRSLRQTPAFTIAVVVTLAVGIGATTAIYSVVHAVLLRPLPYAQPDRLVRIWETNAPLNIPRFSASALNFLSWQERSRSFEALAVIRGRAANLTGDGEPERVVADTVTADFWTMTGIRMVAGRAFTRDEAMAGSDRVAIVSERLWRERYGSNPAIIGRTIAVNDEQRVVVGVAPQDVGHTADTDLWMPLVIDPAEEDRGNHVVTAIGKLRPGLRLSEAEAELNVVAEGLEREFPKSNAGWRVRLLPVKDWIVDANSRDSLYVLMTAVALFLIVACANVGGLLVTRATARSHEFGVRMALGAGRSRLVRQLITESLIIATFGGGVGVVVALGAIHWLAAKAPNQLPRSSNLTLDWPVFIFALALTMVVGVLFGLAPSWSARRADIHTTLRSSGRGTTGTGATLRLWLVGGQVAVATVLVVAALLLIQSFGRLQRVDPGFKPDHLLTVTINLPEARYSKPEQGAAFYDALLREIQAMPGVVSAGVTSGLPMAGGNTSMPIVSSPRPSGVPEQGVQALWRMATADYLRTMQIPLKRGRFFTANDLQLPPIILSERLVPLLWPDGSDPLGRQVRLGNSVVFTVVGIVGDVRMQDLRSEPISTMYMPPFGATRGLRLAIRTTGPPEAFAATLRGVVKRMDPTQPLFNVRTMEQIVGNSAEAQRTQTTLLTAFAALALLLGAVGVAGVVAYTVERRAKDLAVRVALGATRAQAMRNAARGGLTAAGIGLAFGLLGAWLLNRWLAALLFQMRPDDPLTFAVVSIILLAVAGAACWFPAQRASRIDPAIALRRE